MRKIFILIIFSFMFIGCTLKDLDVPPMEKIYEDDYVVQYRVYYQDLNKISYTDKIILKDGKNENKRF